MMSVIYVFDVSAYPFMHIPFYLLTILYLGSVIEIYGIFRLGRWVTRRYAQLRRRRNNLRVVSSFFPQLPPFVARLFVVPACGPGH